MIAYYQQKKCLVCAQRRNRSRYALSELNGLYRKTVLKQIQLNIMQCTCSEDLKDISNNLIEQQSIHCSKISKGLLTKTVCKIVASKLLAKSL